MAIFAQTEEDPYTSMYDSVGSVTDKLGVVRSAEEGGDAPESFYAYVLDRTLVKYFQNSSATEILAADSIVRIAVERLGDTGYADAAPNIWRAVTTVSDPLPRASALAALGRIKALNYFPSARRVLLNKNLLPVSQNWVGAERLAYGAISSLENFGDPAGYAPVFLASQGWYSRRTRQKAAAALEKISPDPSDSLIEIIKASTYSYHDKLAALNGIDASSVPDGRKAEAAVAALSEGWRLNSGDIKEMGVLSALREKAVSMIGQYGVPEDAAGVYQLLDKSYKRGYRENEKIDAVKTLSALASADSIELLSSYLRTMNTRLQDNVFTVSDERMVRAIISALGATRMPEAGPALRTVSLHDWTSAIKRLAKGALQNVS
jgi:HEAT repeat protein